MVWIVIFLLVVVGAQCLRFAYQITHFFGMMSWAERKFGAGGSYLVWRLAGIGFILFAMLLMRYPGLLGFE